jgi:hypothetical protein
MEMGAFPPTCPLKPQIWRPEGWIVHFRSSSRAEFSKCTDFLTDFFRPIPWHLSGWEADLGQPAIRQRAYPTAANAAGGTKRIL